VLISYIYTTKILANSTLTHRRVDLYAKDFIRTKFHTINLGFFPRFFCGSGPLVSNFLTAVSNLSQTKRGSVGSSNLQDELLTYARNWKLKISTNKC